jgi:hypothetical protein
LWCRRFGNRSFPLERYVCFESGDNSFGTGNVPQLIVTYTP